jgi:putative addiction module component (TIGR02574 family)
MTDTATRIKDAALRLSDEDRLELARALWDSIDAPPDKFDEEAAWVAELNRSAADLTSGRANAEPVDKVFAELREEALQEKRGR